MFKLKFFLKFVHVRKLIDIKGSYIFHANPAPEFNIRG
jgi:hypothetical protein